MSQSLASINDNIRSSFTLIGDAVAQKVYSLGGSLSVTPAFSVTGIPLGVTLNPVAAQLAAANTDRKSLLITNNGSGNLFIGMNASVGITGPFMGNLVPPTMCYTDSGFGIYTGAVWGIYSVTVTAVNISVSDRS